MNAPDKCPRCGAPRQPCLNAAILWFDCGSMVDAGDGTWHEETGQCVSRQRDQLRAQVETLKAELQMRVGQLNDQDYRTAKWKAYAERLEQSADGMAQLLADEGWESSWQNNHKKTKETKP